eukprot:NODE_2250_length_959_cov_43.350549_g1854_i0.p1 GENE.NODE_2250_length_959_cov_43.350549_g1854_i0~~NODE_2250_length_959_cov_43.350549_g1854_i0.p1  ORF type:complete len:168 (-),score=11.49 NODE_2250_length_959_cov_43.350549_g1854_i0:411-914(-)
MQHKLYFYFHIHWSARNIKWSAGRGAESPTPRIPPSCATFRVLMAGMVGLDCLRLPSDAFGPLRQATRAIVAAEGLDTPQKEKQPTTALRLSPSPHRSTILEAHTLPNNYQQQVALCHWESGCGSPAWVEAVAVAVESGWCGLTAKSHVHQCLQQPSISLSEPTRGR